MQNSGELVEHVQALAASALDGRAKMWTIFRALGLRRGHAALFEHGTYVPLEAAGDRAEHVVAFARRHAAQSVLVIAGRLWAKLGGDSGVVPTGADVWGDTSIEADSEGALVNVLTGETLQAQNGRLRVADALSGFPAALLVAHSS